MAISNIGKDDFKKNLAMWGRANAGSGVRLGFSSGVSGSCPAYDVAVVDAIERAMVELKRIEPGLFDLLEFKYVCFDEPRSLLDLRFKFKLSERQIAQLVRDGECLVRGYFNRDCKAA